MNCFFIFEGLVTSVETGFSPIVGRTLLMSAGVTLRQPLIATLRSFLECERNVFEHHHESSELHNKALNRYTKIN